MSVKCFECETFSVAMHKVRVGFLIRVHSCALMLNKTGSIVLQTLRGQWFSLRVSSLACYIDFLPPCYLYSFQCKVSVPDKGEGEGV